MVRAVGEMASMKRRKLWKMGEDGLCCSSSTIQTRLGPSSPLEERSEIPIVFVVGYPTNWGETAKVYSIFCFEMVRWGMAKKRLRTTDVE